LTPSIYTNVGVRAFSLSASQPRHKENSRRHKTNIEMHSYSAKIVLRTDAQKKDGTHPLYLQAFVNKKRIRIPVGISVRKKHFRKEVQRVAIPGKKKESIRINGILHKIKSKVEDIFYHAILHDIYLDEKQFFDLYDQESLGESFIEFVETETAKYEGSRAPGTIKNYRKLIRSLKEFKPDLVFRQLNYNLVSEYDRFLHRKKYEPNTVWAYHKNFKKFILLAIKRGKKLQNPYSEFSFSRARTERVFLTQVELQTLIREYEDPTYPDYLRRVLRYFLFMCFTGIRVSDLKELKEENVVDGNLVFRPVKTRNTRMILTVPLNGFARRLIRESDATGEWLFNCISDQKTNDYLKKICDYAGIDKKVTTATGRHTFATMFLSLGGKVEVLRKILGHAKLETTMVYVHISHDQKKEQMNNFNKVFKI